MSFSILGAGFLATRTFEICRSLGQFRSCLHIAFYPTRGRIETTRSQQQWRQVRLCTASAGVITGVRGGRIPTSRGNDNQEGELSGQVERPVTRKSGRGVNERKRLAQLSQNWAMELTKLAPKELQMAGELADFSDDVMQAVELAKTIGPKGKNAYRRQLRYAGGLLRNIDPTLMEACLHAARDGGLGGFVPPAHVLRHQAQPEDQFDDGEVEEEPHEEEEEAGADEVTPLQKQVARWHKGLLSEDRLVCEEIYSLNIPSFDRQDLRKLVRAAMKGQQKDYSLQADGTSIRSSSEALTNPPGNLVPGGGDTAIIDFLTSLALKADEANMEM